MKTSVVIVVNLKKFIALALTTIGIFLPITPANAASCYEVFVINGIVNVRDKPSTSAKIIRKIKPPYPIIKVCSTTGGWSKLSTGGYVRSDLVTTYAPKADPAPAYSYKGKKAAAVLMATHNLRKSCSTSSAIIAKVPEGTALVFTWADANGTWGYTSYKGLKGCMAPVSVVGAS